MSSQPNLEKPKNTFIPKGKELPRTPPVYCRGHGTVDHQFTRGCDVNPPSFLHQRNLRVKPLENPDHLDDVHPNNDAVNIKDDYVTFRKHPLSKAYNLDLLLSEMMEEVSIDCKDLLADENPKMHIKLHVHFESDNAVEDSGVVKHTEQQCGTTSNARIAENVLKDNVKCKTHMGVGDSSLKNVIKQEEDNAVEKQRGNTRRTPKVHSFISEQDKKCSDKDRKLEVERNKENITEQKVCYSAESLEKNRGKSNKKKKFSPLLDIQPRRNPSRRAKEGISYRL